MAGSPQELVQELEGGDDFETRIHHVFPLDVLNRIQQTTVGFPAGFPVLADLVSCSDASVGITMQCLRRAGCAR